MDKTTLRNTIINRIGSICNDPMFPHYLSESFDTIYDLGADTFNKWAMFLAQCSHESSGFTVREENLNYSKKALLRVFPKYFNEATAEKFARNPRAIADIVYGGRMGNHLEGDGWLFRGRGDIMITGSDNYRLYGYYDSPWALLDPKNALVAAAKYFAHNSLWTAADTLNLKYVTKRINGGYIGLEDRLLRLKKFCAKTVTPKNLLLKVGSRGPEVKAFQAALVKLGYLEKRDADGIFGPHTKAEVIAYQKDNGLVADGIVGEITYHKLLAA